MGLEGEFIYEREGWPRFAWDGDAVGLVLGEVRHAQGRLLGKMEGLGFVVRSEASLGALTSEVVKSSAIEGERLDAGEVRSSIARRLGIEAAGVKKAGRQVEGVVEMMLDATQRFGEPLTRERLFAWHRMLFPGAEKKNLSQRRGGAEKRSKAEDGERGRESGRVGRSWVGAWRTDGVGPMQVVSGPMGRERVHFEAPGAARLEGEMAAFLSWLNGPVGVDAVVKAGIAHLWFVTVHPFEDGNGRMARAIAEMLLARADGTTERFYSMSSQIEAERKDYYRELESAQRGELDITRWLVWFVGCLGRAIGAADEEQGAVLRKARVWEEVNRGPVNERQRVVINRLLDGWEGFLTTSKYATIAKCSADTALRDIQELVERGVLVQNAGGGRSTSYRLS